MQNKSAISGCFLVGPTAVGKSAVAHCIALQDHCNILSADSMLIYKGMDVGTAKPSRADMAAVRYYGIDIVPPDVSYSVWAFKTYAYDVLEKIHSRGERAIIVGGTGLYIKALMHGLTPGPGVDPGLRAKWNNVLNTQGIGPLQEFLLKKDPELYKSLSDNKNPRRLIRAIERVEAVGTGVKNGLTEEWMSPENGPVLVGLKCSPEELNLRIESRVRAMYCQGLVEEVRMLMEQGKQLSVTARQAIGYAEASDLLNGHCSKEEAIARTIIRTRQYAKRQKTWFSRQTNVKWIDVDAGMNTAEIADLVKEYWRKYEPVPIKK